MNALALLSESQIPNDLMAFHQVGGDFFSFGELKRAAAQAQKELRRMGVGAGDYVLLADSISAEFYSVVMAVLGIGARVLLVEPFLPVHELDSIILETRPKVLVASFMGRCWGLKSREVRRIPVVMSSKRLTRIEGATATFEIESMHPESAAIVTFTTGTTGKSKGVVRTHAGLIAQNQVIRSESSMDRFSGPDLAIFANLTLANLGMGRGTLFIPPRWSERSLKQLTCLPQHLVPETLSCGPGFLSRLIEKKINLPSLKSIHVGGALSDCSLIRKLISSYPETRLLHVYGSSEAEPVAHSELRRALKLSENAGYQQVLYLGAPIQRINIENGSDSLWVSGDHVCRSYISNPEENARSKRIASDGSHWHSMGDRIAIDSDGLWFQGRSGQDPGDFRLEQEIYSVLGHTRAFLFRNDSGEKVLSGEDLNPWKRTIQQKFPEINHIQEKKIIRDRRHRARIDRGASR